MAVPLSRRKGLARTGPCPKSVMCALSQWRHGGPRGTCAAANGDARGNCGFEYRVILRYKRRSAFWRLGQMGHRHGSTLPAQEWRRSVPTEVGSQFAPMEPESLFRETERVCLSHHTLHLLSNTAPPAHAMPPMLAGMDTLCHSRASPGHHSSPDIPSVGKRSSESPPPVRHQLSHTIIVSSSLANCQGLSKKKIKKTHPVLCVLLCRVGTASPITGSLGTALPKSTQKPDDPPRKHAPRAFSGWHHEGTGQKGGVEGWMPTIRH